MGISLEFFTKPIPIPCTVRETRISDESTDETIDHRGIFWLRRPDKKDRDELTNMSINPAVTAEVFRLHQMALLLEKEPTRFVVGTREEFPMFDDFPTDDRPLSERAFEYFGHEGLQNIVRCVMEQYHASLMPLELLNMYNK